MLINYDAKAIFFHNVKCGGNSVKNILQTYGFIEICEDTHDNYIEFVEDESQVQSIKDKHTIRTLGKYRYFYTHQDANKEYLDSYFKFIFVRNPYAKLVSAYLYLKRSLKQYNNTIRGLEENIEYFEDFNIFVKNYQNINNISFFHGFMRQYDYILDFSGNANFQYIGKTETFNEDIINICAILNIQIDDIELLQNTHNHSLYEKDIIEYYNEESFFFVNEYFKKDFEAFDYKKYDSFHEFQINFGGKNEVNKKFLKKKTDIIKNYIPDYFVKIPSFINRENISIENDQLIPRVIFQTYKHNHIHPEIYKNIMKILNKNPKYNYQFITDEDGEKLIRENFDEQVLLAFKRLTLGAAKGDFIRYIVLYLYGGIYLDLDAGININLDLLIPEKNDMFFIYESNKALITNWFIGITPKHIIMKNIIEEMVQRIHTNIDTNIISITGPRLVTDVIYNYYNGTNIYNTQKELQFDIFHNFILDKNKIYKIFYESFYLNKTNIINFNFHKYNNKMIYYNEYKYTNLNYNIFCEDIYKVQHVFDNDKDTYSIAKLIDIFDETINKYKNICELLFCELNEKNQYNMLKDEMNELYTNQTKNYIKNIYEVVFDERKNILLNNIIFCRKCQFKCYNKLSYYAHDYFCI